MKYCKGCNQWVETMINLLCVPCESALSQDARDRRARVVVKKAIAPAVNPQDYSVDRRTDRILRLGERVV
jgi:hypothetical protein